MGDFMIRFFGHSGRITRRAMWLGLLALVVLAIAIELILSLFLGSISMEGQNDWRQLIMLIILTYPLSALWFKRSHDINRSGLLVVIYLGVAMLSYIVGIVGLGYNIAQVGEMHMLERTWLSTFIQVIYMLLALYLIVTLGFFAGTKGSNLYGVDPRDE